MATKPKMTVEEKLAAAEAQAEVWKSESRRLANELHEAREDAALAAGRQMAERKRLEDVAKQWQDAGEKARKEREEEVNGLRGIIRELEIANAKQTGYIDGLEETLPPRMVEERRRLTRQALTPETFFAPNAAGGRFGHGVDKPWWHK